MESKSFASGVVRHRLAKEDYEAESSSGAKGGDEKGQPHHASDSKGSFDNSQAKGALREIEEDLDADDEFEALKRAPTVVAPVIAPTKYARNFVAGFKMYESCSDILVYDAFIDCCYALCADYR